ncbi:MAG: DMT family transporter [Pseudomonadota bacterium]
MLAPLRPAIAWLYQQPYLLLGLCALFWAGNAIAAQFARGEITAMQHVLIRWIMVWLLVWPFFGRQVVQNLAAARGQVWKIVYMAIMGFTGFNILFYVASYNTTAVNVGILQGSVPVLVLIGAFLLLRHGVKPLQWVGVTLTLMGVVMVATRGTPWQIFGITFNFGDITMLVACACYASYAVLLPTRPAMSGAVFFTMMVPIAIVTAIPPVIYEAVTVETYVWPSLQGWLVTLFVAVFPATLAQQFFMRGVELIGPGRAGVFTNLVPVFASALAVLILGEIFAWYHGAALVLVLGGIWLTQRSA